jgi:2,4-dienoyl-CoA reductase-like NADH-dependent reductase (Old Yellow Enzyme family)/thioredoxin reductase
VIEQKQCIIKQVSIKKAFLNFEKNIYKRRMCKMKNKDYPTLFSPIRIGNFEVPNRICHVPTDITSANADGSINDRVTTYHEEIARGGAGFIIVGASTPDKKTGRPTVGCVAVDEDPMIMGLTKLNEAMQRFGAKTSVQIQHPGRQAAWPRKDLISATDMVVDVPASAGHEVVYAESEAKGKSVRSMTVEEVYELIEKFAEGAWRVQQAGFNSVELHAAHGYLLAQFMTPYVNRRNDRFGGTFMNRMRCVLEIINHIKYKCGDDFAIGIRYSGEEYIDGGRTLDESIKIAKLMEEFGVAFLDVSAGIFEVPAPTLDPMYYPQGWNTYTAEEVKKHVKIPVITSHTLRDPGYCEKILMEKKTDMVGLSRQLIADPYWGNKAKIGQKDEIRKCISCLIGCWHESLMVKREMRCAINPAVGDERFIHVKPAEKSHNVAIVGGGPGGMEAARYSALRGHKVTLFEKTGELGGAILLCCTVPGKSKMRWYADWIRRQIKKMDIDVKFNTEPAAKDLKGYDAVILASGGEIVRPDIRGIESANVITFEDVLRCGRKNCEYYTDDKVDPVECGDNVIIWGDHFGAADAAEKLGVDGKKLYIITENKEFCEWMEPIHKDVMMKRLAGGNGECLKTKTFAHPVTIIPSSTVLEISDSGEIIIMDNRFQRSRLRADTIVLASVAADDGFYKELVEAGVKVVKIGDQKRVKNLRGAVTDGANIALNIDRGLMLNANNEFISNLPSEAST